ncbi:MAG: MobV family relaxase [Clostridia bacterium]
MSFAIIRNTKYKRENLKGIYRHNERRNKNYSNDNIDKEKSYLNYSLKSPKFRYDKEFDMMREKYNLKGQIKKVSNIACEYIITSDKQFFEEIGEEETKRYFETAYQFVAEYKNLGEQYIMSAKVHMDEETPHMHLIFLPVVHTQDKKGNNIDKLACSEFWKEKDSYRRLQDAFYQYMTSHSFELERGVPKEETEREHIDIKEYKEITNFDKTKEKLQNMKLELPDVPDIDDIRMARWSKKRDEKILEDIIKPKDDLINELYQNNLLMHQQLLRQAKMVEEAEKYQKERNKIIADNIDLHKQVDNIKAEYQQKEDNLEWKYKGKIHKLEEENNQLHRIVDKFHETINEFIEWICKKFDMGAEDNLVRDFEKETRTYLDVEKQIKREDKEKEWDDLEI